MGVSHQNLRNQQWNQIRSDQIETVKKGTLLKQSKYLKEWRMRDFILVTGHLFAFPQPANKSTPPTLAITLHQISSLSKQDIQPYYFIQIQAKSNDRILLKTLYQDERDDWFSLLKQQKIKCLRNSSLIPQANLQDPSNILFAQARQNHF